MGSSLLVNDLFLYQLLSNKPELPGLERSNQSDQSDLQNFVSLPDLYNNFFHEKKLEIKTSNISKLVSAHIDIDIDLDEFYQFEKNYIEALRNSNKKEFIKFLQDQAAAKSQLDSFSSQVKFMILKIKLELGNKIYSNVDNIIIMNQRDENLEEFCLKTGSILISEKFNCIGCDYWINQSKFKSINNYVDFHACIICYEIFCQSCVQYLICNNLGCSNCN